MEHPLLDLYDDLSTNQHDPAQRQKLSSATLSEGELAKLPDSLFGLVGTLDGLPFRKFAMHDAMHFASSVLYFMENRHKLPVETQLKVAHNLQMASEWYSPEEIDKVGALGALLSLSAVPDKLRAAKEQKQSTMDSFRAAQASGLKVAGISGDVSEEEVRRGEGRAFKVMDTVRFRNNAAGDLERLIGGDTSMLLRDKTAAWQPCGEITFVGERPAAVTATHFALPEAALYPLETSRQVKTAAHYFDEHVSAFSLEERREFATNLAQRAEELGVKVAGAYQSYAGEDYGTYLRFELDSRIRNYAGTSKVAGYEALRENLNEIPPSVMVELLKTADAQTGANACYGRSITGFRDPYRAVYEKRASKAESYTWAGQGHHVTEDTLSAYARKSPQLDEVFGAGFSRRYAENPVAVFRGLEESKKVVFARLANYDTTH